MFLSTYNYAWSSLWWLCALQMFQHLYMWATWDTSQMCRRVITWSSLESNNIAVSRFGAEVLDSFIGTAFDISCHVMMLWYIWPAMGATGVNATVSVTYSDDTTANLTAFALGATPRAGRMYPLTPTAGKRIKSVNSVTLSATTGTAGNFGITATRPLATLAAYVANKPEVHDWAQLGLPEVPNGACLQLLMQCSTTVTGSVRGQLRIAHG